MERTGAERLLPVLRKCWQHWRRRNEAYSGSMSIGDDEVEDIDRRTTRANAAIVMLWLAGRCDHRVRDQDVDRVRDAA